MEDVLEQALPEPAGAQSKVMEAMRYAVLGGGKRLRPFLLVETGRLFGQNHEGTWKVAASIECLHTYSLIHDDLPCMDDDDLRRGKPTVHKAYDEATAVLAGDALLTLAFELLADAENGLDAPLRLKLITGLAQASGVYGMIGGQVIDLLAGNNRHNAERIAELQALKTGALIRYACLAGAQINGASALDLQRIEIYANALGQVFQIRDDLLDTEGDASVIGKAVKKDAGLGKATFVSHYGADSAKAKARSLACQAKAALETYGSRADVSKSTVDFVLNRQK